MFPYVSHGVWLAFVLTQKKINQYNPCKKSGTVLGRPREAKDKGRSNEESRGGPADSCP